MPRELLHEPRRRVRETKEAADLATRSHDPRSQSPAIPAAFGRGTENRRCPFDQPEALASEHPATRVLRADHRDFEVGVEVCLWIRLAYVLS